MRKKRPKLRPDAAETAYRTMLEATGQAEKTPPPGARGKEQKNPEAVSRGAKGGKKGGDARARALPEGRRVEIAKEGAKARWQEPS